MSQNESLYQALVSAGIQIDHHESDLYFPCNAETRAILERFPLQRANAQVFKSQTEPVGALWYDVPFAYEPHWEAARRRCK